MMLARMHFCYLLTYVIIIVWA